MNISENKRVVALSAVFALAFGGILYHGFCKQQEYSETMAKLDEIKNRFEGYDAAEFSPTQATLKELQKATDEVKAVNKEMQEDLNRYASFCFGDGKQISAQDFQNQLRGAIDRIRQLGDSKGRKCVSDAAADLGLAAFKNAAPVQEDVPFRSFQLKAVERVAQIALNAGDVVLDKVYCAPLPPEAAEAAKPNSRKAKAYFPLSFEVALEVKRGAIPAIINSMVADKDFMFSITGIAVKGMETLPHISPYVAPGAPAAQGDDLGGSAATAATPGRKVAERKTGSPDETARVHFNIQVQYFNPAKTK